MSDIITKEQFEAQGLRAELHMANERIRELEATLKSRELDLEHARNRAELYKADVMSRSAVLENVKRVLVEAGVFYV